MAPTPSNDTITFLFNGSRYFFNDSNGNGIKDFTADAVVLALGTALIAGDATLGTLTQASYLV